MHMKFSVCQLLTYLLFIVGILLHFLFSVNIVNNLFLFVWESVYVYGRWYYDWLYICRVYFIGDAGLEDVHWQVSVLPCWWNSVSHITVYSTARYCTLSLSLSVCVGACVRAQCIPLQFSSSVRLPSCHTYDPMQNNETYSHYTSTTILVFFNQNIITNCQKHHC